MRPGRGLAYCLMYPSDQGEHVDSRVGTTFGKYTITRLIGRGGMGEVYEAQDTTKGRTVALKVLAEQYSKDANFRTRFQRESRAAAVLQEPHVIPIHDWGEIDGNLYIDMRLVQGHTLHELLERGPLPPARAVSIVAQVAEAIDAAHAAGLIHRDVKPQNIIVTASDFAYLVDFGIAETSGDSRLTTAGARVGTLNYMAPERFMGKPSTAAVDVYALACVLYEALTGDPPFTGDSVESQLAAHISSPPPRPSAVNPHIGAALDAVVARGMAKDPDDRYGGAGALGRAAQRALQTTTPLVDATTAITPADALGPSRSGTRGGRGWILPTAIAVAGALVLAGVGVLIGVLAREDSERAAPPTATTGSGPPTTAASGRPPALVTGPDQSSLHHSCDDGFTLPNGTGFGIHAGRGSAATSCLFTQSVLTSYWADYGNASPLPRAVSAPGSVDCSSVTGALCDGSNFLLQCQQYQGDGWITCTGGLNARVYLW
jgi:serine/threonine protein kinase